MADTKENILHAALRLFARDGYEAVSVSKIAGELGMTKGALYKHYKNKQAIFDSIVERIYQVDVARAKEYEMPEKVYKQSSESYRTTAVDHIRNFLKVQFLFWTENEFASNFRKMLTLEQYRNPAMMELYQKCLVSGPVRYMEDLFREMMELDVWNKADPRCLALELYAPFYLLISISDSMRDKKNFDDLLDMYMEQFIEKAQNHTKKE